jgi:hypothetical protein
MIGYGGDRFVQSGKSQELWMRSKERDLIHILPPQVVNIVREF